MVALRDSWLTPPVPEVDLVSHVEAPLVAELRRQQQYSEQMERRERAAGGVRGRRWREEHDREQGERAATYRLLDEYV